jgi:crotonobetainyl-CoA:carnitine CoA-transferase CaiB-like acyl-CoA transferase
MKDLPILHGYRVLDLTDERGLLCGRTLGDWGADVIKVERPGGDPARNIGPFFKDIKDPEKSLFWFATNANKRGITLNLKTEEGLNIFKRLVEMADLVIESFDPGYMDSIGLGYSELERINPKVILTSITPFGQTGPYRSFKASDIVLWALSGMMYLCGDPDRPPIQLSVPQSYFLGSLHGAVGSMMALYYRELTGKGQHVDVSIQEAVNYATMIADETYDLLGFILSRSGPYYSQIRPEPMGPIKERVIYECKDGYVSTLFRGGAMGFKNSARAQVAWMKEEGMAGSLNEYDWDTYNFATIKQEEREALEEPLKNFFRTKTKRELTDRAARDSIILASVSTVKDLIESEQLKVRGYWIEVEHPELGVKITYPGAPVKISAGHPWAIYRRAPLIGEHNEEIYIGELGISRKGFEELKFRGII